MFLWIKKFFSQNKNKSIDESKNIIDSMVKAKSLYKDMIIKAHPDRNKDKEELAKLLTEEIINNRYNYRELLKLKERVKKELENEDI